jgi:hypothetical protein
MILDKKAIEEFQKLYFLEYGRKLNFKKAQILATNFMELVKAIYKPISRGGSTVRGD